MKFQVNNNEVYASTGGRPFDKNKPLIIFVHGSVQILLMVYSYQKVYLL